MVDPTDRYTISGTGYGLEGRCTTPPGTSDTIEHAILPYVVASDARLVDGKVVGDPTEGALLVLAHKAGLDIEATRERCPRLATLPFDPTYKLMAAFNRDDGRLGQDGRALLRQGRGAGGASSRAATALSGGASVPWDEDLQQRAEDARRPHGGRRACG